MLRVKALEAPGGIYGVMSVCVSCDGHGASRSPCDWLNDRGQVTLQSVCLLSWVQAPGGAHMAGGRTQYDITHISQETDRL